MVLARLEPRLLKKTPQISSSSSKTATIEPTTEPAIVFVLFLESREALPLRESINASLLKLLRSAVTIGCVVKLDEESHMTEVSRPVVSVVEVSVNTYSCV